HVGAPLVEKGSIRQAATFAGNGILSHFLKGNARQIPRCCSRNSINRSEANPGPVTPAVQGTTDSRSTKSRDADCPRNLPQISFFLRNSIGRRRDQLKTEALRFYYSSVCLFLL